jgi:hypothetical protein
MRKVILVISAAFGLTGSLLAAPAKDSDSVLVGTKWRGKLTQRGTFSGGANGPPQFDILLVVTKRDGNKFEAELQEKTKSLSVTYLVKGEIAPAADGKTRTLKFESFDSKDVDNTAPILGIPYSATLTGKSMKGTWKLKRADKEIDIEGDFTVELGK